MKSISIPLLFALLVCVAQPAWAGRGTLPQFQGVEDMNLDTPASTPSTQPQNTDRLPVVFTPRSQVIISSEVASRVVAISHELGQSFSKGNVLIKLDDAIYRANMDKAKAAVTETTEVYSVNDRLSQDNTVSQLDLEKARSELAKAKADLRIAQKQVADCRIVAPYGGKVDRVMVNLEERVQQGQPLIGIVDDEVLRIKFLVPSTSYSKVKIGGAVHIDVTETGQAVQGLITHIGAVIDPSSKTFEVFAEVMNKDGALRSGMSGYLTLPKTP